MIEISNITNELNTVQVPVRIEKHGEGNNDLFGYYFFLCATKSEWLSEYDKRAIERFSTEDSTLKAMLVIDDKRKISPKQQKLANSLLSMICKHHGYKGAAIQEMREHIKIMYLKKTNARWFSLSDCSITEANNYIDYLIELTVDMGIELPIGMIKDEFTTKFVYACMLTRTCCITGKKVAVHYHHSNKKVGMGRNRDNIDHTEFEFMPLVAELHQEAHTIGDKAFCEKYKIYGVRLSEQDLYKVGIDKKWKDKLDKGEDYE